MAGPKKKVSTQVDEETDQTDDAFTGKVGEEPKGLLGDLVKKVFSAGVTAAFLTEENVRQYLGDLKLPKEFLQLLLSQANRSKEEIVNKVSKEMVGILSQIDFVKEMSRFAETHRFKITAEIEIEKKTDEKGQTFQATIRKKD